MFVPKLFLLFAVDSPMAKYKNMAEIWECEVLWLTPDLMLAYLGMEIHSKLLSLKRKTSYRLSLWKNAWLFFDCCLAVVLINPQEVG